MIETSTSSSSAADAATLEPPAGRLIQDFTILAPVNEHRTGRRGDLRVLAASIACTVTH